MVATTSVPLSAATAGMRENPTIRRHRTVPAAGSRPNTSPRWVSATRVPSTSASGAPTVPVVVRHRRRPVCASSAYTWPSGRALAAYTVSPTTSTPPPMMPPSRDDHCTCPLARSTAYTFRSTPPP